MSAMSERAAVIDQLIADLPAEDLKSLAVRLASQVGYELIAEPPPPMAVDDDNVAPVVDYVMRYGGRCRGCADENGVCPQSGLPCESHQARKAISWVIEAIRYGVTHGYIASPFALSPKQFELAVAKAEFVHLNMLRGGIAKLTPGQIGHLYRGEEAVAVVGEIRRQNPDAFRPAIPAEPRGMKCPHCNGTGELEVFGIGDLVKARRKAAGMTQEELSGRTSISRAQIANIEAGRSDIPVKTLMRLADGIGCKAGDLLP